MRREYRPGRYHPIEDVPSDQILRRSSYPVDVSDEVWVTESGVLVDHRVYQSSVNVGQTVSGQKLPGWKDKVRAGLDATTPLTAELRSVEPGLVSGVVNFVVSGTPYSATFRGPSTIGIFDTSLPLNDDPDQLARIKLWRKLRGHYESMAGGPFLGELGKTLRDIRRPAKAVSDAVEGMLRSKQLRDLAAAQIRAGYRPDRWNGREKLPRSLERKLKDISHRSADLWLTNSFSLRPTLADLDGSMKALASLVETPRSITIVAVGKADGSSCYTVDRSIGGDGIDKPFCWLASVEDRVESAVYYRAHIIARATFDGPLDKAISLTQQFGLTPGDILTTGYELMPWSFLLDYFNTMGDVVNAQALSTPGLTWMNKTTRTLYERKVSGSVDYPRTYLAYNLPGWFVTGVAGDVYRCRNVGKLVTRESVLPSQTLPRLEWRTRLSPMKLANIAALMAGFLGRR